MITTISKLIVASVVLGTAACASSGTPAGATTARAPEVAAAPAPAFETSFESNSESKSDSSKPSAKTADGAARDLDTGDRWHQHGPISLTGSLPYLERFDPSGWSGSSTPKGMGGGPAALSDNPYEEGGAPASAPTSAPTMTTEMQPDAPFTAKPVEPAAAAPEQPEDPFAAPAPAPAPAPEKPENPYAE